jgi:2-iminobutanoate/2-iminopropanoate deaminase
VWGDLSLVIYDNPAFCPCASFYRATIENIVNEILFVTDMDAAFAATVKCRQEIFSDAPVIAGTIVQIQRLA